MSADFRSLVKFYYHPFGNLGLLEVHGKFPFVIVNQFFCPEKTTVNQSSVSIAILLQYGITRNLIGRGRLAGQEMIRETLRCRL